MRSIVLLILVSISTSGFSQSMDEKLKSMAEELTLQILKKGGTTTAISTIQYKDSDTEFGRFLSEQLIGHMSLVEPPITVVNQQKFEYLLEQNKLTASGLVKINGDAAKLGKASGIDVLIYGTVSNLGEDLQLTLNMVKLPTLAVIGFVKRTFPLTPNISSMLKPTSSAPALMPSSSVEDVRDNSNSSTRPEVDCEAKRTCVLCITNKSEKDMIVSRSRYNTENTYKDLLLHPKDTKCWNEVQIRGNSDFYEIKITYKQDFRIVGADKLIVESCKVYNKDFSQ